MLSCCASIVSGSRVVAQDIIADPDSVPLEVVDLRTLADVVRRLNAAPAQDTVALVDSAYLAKASPGLRAWIIRYGVTGASISSALASHPEQYADLDGLVDVILAKEVAIRAAFRKLRELHPSAVFLPVWFFAGHHEAAGLARPEGVLIAAETVADTSEIVPLVLHEMAHIQQATVQGLETYRSIFGPAQSLLALAIREGAAELIAELTAGRQGNPARNRYGELHEQQIWARFRQEMTNGEPGDWMFVRPSAPEQPGNLGYWVGYRIAKAYYDRAADKRQAIRDILGVTDYRAFLAASGYSGVPDG
jgi:hypothetical protein